MFPDFHGSQLDEQVNSFKLLMHQRGESWEERHCQVEQHGVFVCGHPDRQVERKIHHTSHKEKETSSEAVEWRQGACEHALCVE